MTTNVIIIMILLFYSCENTIIDNSIGINYGVVINEINYRSSNIVNPPEDWVELHNPTDEAIAIGLWAFKDNNNVHVFTIPEDQILKAGQYLILCEDTVAFKKYSLDVGNFVADFVGNFGFGLKSEGDQVRLFDSNGDPVDKMHLRLGYVEISPG